MKARHAALVLLGLGACGDSGPQAVPLDGGGPQADGTLHDGRRTLCAPGQTIACACIGGGEATQVCNATGQSYGACGCPGGDGSPDSGGNPPCVSGTEACLGATPESCVSGLWVTGQTCGGASPVCLHGACVECAPGAMRCSGGSAEQCTVAGAWEPEAACSCGESFCGGECIDSQSDPANCGACGHNCYGGLCMAGVCQPATITSGQIAPFAIAVDASYIYWTNHAEMNGSVVKMPLSGGTLTTMATGLQAPTHITVDADNVYWTSDDWRAFNPMLDAGPPSGGVLMLPLAGGTPVTLASGLYSPDWITVSGGTLLWDDWGNPEDSSGGSVSQIEARQGASVVTLATGQLSPTGLAVNAANLYWCNQGDDNPGDGVVFALPRPPQGGAASTLATIPQTGMSNPIYLAIDTTHVYWTDFTNGIVVAEPIGGGVQTTLAKGVAPYGIAADGANVYWSDWGNGTVMKVALNGGVITTLATGQDNPLTIVVDSTRVYWASYNRGTILSIAK